MSIVVRRSTVLDAPVDEVWRHATSMDGINVELAPLSMSHPPRQASLPDDVPLGQPLFTSTLRFGPLPFDRHEVTIAAMEPGAWFQEDSTSWWHRRWRHRREVTPTGSGCTVTDHLEIEPRLPGAGPATRWLVTWIFARRHRVLVARFGRPRARR